jgi:hypothetical protein
LDIALQYGKLAEHAERRRPRSNLGERRNPAMSVTDSARSLSWSETCWRAGFFVFQVIFPEPFCRLIDFGEVILPAARQSAVKAKPRRTQECVVHSSSRFVPSTTLADLVYAAILCQDFFGSAGIAEAVA